MGRAALDIMDSADQFIDSDGEKIVVNFEKLNLSFNICSSKDL